MTHWADNYATVGRIRTMSTQVTESRYKSSVKTKARKTNNQASFGGSLLQNNMEVEAAIELARHLDETGLHRVRTGFDQTWSGLVGSYHSNRPVLVCTKFSPSSCHVQLVCTKFVLGLATNGPFFWEKRPVGKSANLVQTVDKLMHFTQTQNKQTHIVCCLFE